MCYNIEIGTKIHRRWQIAVLLLLWPVVGAAAPAPVQGVTAANVDGNAHVTWQAVDNAAYYRIYYSSQSILENNGIYDDFIDTDGPVTEYDLDGTMLTNKVYVAVLAFDANGEQGSVFLEEASVVLDTDPLDQDGVTIAPGEVKESSASSAPNTLTVTAPATTHTTTQSSDAAVPEWQEPVDDGKLHLLLTEATSANEVLLQFNMFPTVEAESAPSAFSIVDGNGRPLQIMSIYIQEEFIVVQTATQVANESYQLRLSEPLTSTTGSPLDATDRKAVFHGHVSGTTKKPTASSAASTESSASSATYQPTVPRAQCNPVDAATVTQVTGLRLRSTQQANGNHNISVSWSYDIKNCAEYLRYVVRQSRDGGRTFSNPQIIPADIAGIEIPNATPGNYGVGISVMNAEGYVSQEVFENIFLPGTIPTPNVPVTPTPTVPTPPVIQPPVQVPHTNTLPSSGAGLFAAGVCSIGLATKLRRKKLSADLPAPLPSAAE